MNILFLSLTSYDSVNQRNIYTDLIRNFVGEGHKLYAVCPSQKRLNSPTTLITEDNAYILKVKTGNITKVGIIEKGISTLLICYQFIGAIKKYFKDVKFDLILYPTPPITLAGVVKYFKKRDNAKTYLLLKDIFPQNAVDIGMMTKKGPKSVIYKMFRKKEEELYRVSDFIGCMSKANVDYVLNHNPWISPQKVHINPNSIEVMEYTKDYEAIREINEKYNIPESATTFIYGGNLGRPQGIPFLIECLKANANKADRFFVICGGGTEYNKLKAYIDNEKPSNVLLIKRLPKEEYEVFVKAFDVGLIFLDHRFTIPNFPSRLLSYMQSRMPVLACTDPNTDIGEVITEGGFGWWCESNDAEKFTQAVDLAVKENLEEIGDCGYEYLKEHYTAKQGADIICKYVENEAVSVQSVRS